MKERPIIFNDEMVRAILAGRKTMTRRPMKVQPESPSFGLSFIAESKRKSDEGKYFWSISDACGLKMRSNPFPCPFGAIGDLLWVRENFAAFDADWIFPGRPHDLKDGPWPKILYQASTKKIPEGTLRPSIHMPRWASRITLEITDVRVERLHDITEGDARSEGVTLSNPRILSHRDEFRQLWGDIYGCDGWRSNPWVWVIGFRRVATGIAASASKGE